MTENLKFPKEFKLWKYDIERLALKFGLDLIPTYYTVVSFEEMSELSAMNGFPVNIPHWRHGQSSIHNKKKYRFGLQRIMEMVANTNPSYAYLLESNTLTTNKAVMAHVTGHVDLFSRNINFKFTNKNMMNAMADDRVRFEKYVAEYGAKRVKKFYDDLLSFEFSIDANALYIRREPRIMTDEETEKKKSDKKIPKRIEVPEGISGSMDDWINTPEWILEQRKKIEEEQTKQGLIEKGVTVPHRPMQDILEFIRIYAPLEEFERGLIDIVRRQSYYFVPQMRTKMLHEGWASLVEEWIMSEKGVMEDCEIFCFADEMTSVQRKKKRGINPYRLGYELLLDIWFRWDTGRHGDIWERCEIIDIKNRWDEFVIFKNIFEETGEDMSHFAGRWREFSAFYQALKNGELGFPKEFFTRNLFTRQYLITAWIKYEWAEKEYKEFQEKLNSMRQYEDKAKSELEKQMCGVKESDVPKELLFKKIRRDVYYSHDKKDLYLWTPDEINLELKALQPLIEFKKRFHGGFVEYDSIPVMSEWIDCARRFPGRVDVGKGKEKVMEVTEFYDDLLVLEEFFTREFCLEHKYFLYKAKPVWDWESYPDAEKKHYFFESRSFERIKKFLLFSYTNFFLPKILVTDGNYDNRGELYLIHFHNGVDLDWSEEEINIRDVLERLYRLWGKRAVHLTTILSETPEEEPFWFNWHRTNESSSRDEPEEINGTVILCSWGPHQEEDGNKKREIVGYYEEEIGEVKFEAPF